MISPDILLYEQNIGCPITALVENMYVIVRDVTNNPEIIWRIKDSTNLDKKMRFKNVTNVLFINDVYGIRILVDTPEEIYAVLKRIQGSFVGCIDHDYVKNPKTRNDKPCFVGKSLRLIQFIAYKNDVPFEIQITTKEWNELHEALHEEYHRDKYS